MPHWSWAQILVALARQYPRGLSFAGKAKPDEGWLWELVRAEAEANPTYRQYVSQIQKSGQSLFAVPEDIALDELAEEAVLMLEIEIDRLKRDNFDDVRSELPDVLAGFDVAMNGVVIVATQGG